MRNNYKILKKFEDMKVTTYVNNEYNKILIDLEYRGISIEFKIIEFIMIIPLFAQAIQQIDISKLDMASELGQLENELKEAVALVKEGKK